MNDSNERSTSRLQNFRSPINLAPSLSSTDIPAPRSPPPKGRISELAISQGKYVSDKAPTNDFSVENQPDSPAQQETDQWRSFQRFSRLKLEQMFPTNPKVSDELGAKKTESTRSLSRERAENKNTMNQKLVNIEENLKKLNGYLMNEFMEKKKYFKELRLPQALTSEAREKIFSFLKQDVPRRENVVPEERKIEDSDPSEERKEEMSPFSADSIDHKLTSDKKGEKTPENTTHDVIEERHERNSTTTDLSQHPSSSIALDGQPDSPLHGRPSIGLGGNDINVGINGEYLGANLGENAEANNGENGAIDNNLETMAVREAHFRLRKALITFLSIFLASMLLLMMYDYGFSHRGVFVVMYGFFLYFFIEGCKKFFSNEGIQWKRVENLFNTLDVTSALCFLVVMDLKISGLISTTTPVAFIPLISCSLYYFCSKAPKSVLESQAVTRTLFTIQIFLVTAKVDATIGWPWKTVLCVLWGYLAMMALYFVLLAFMMVLMVILSVFKISLYQNMDTKTQIIGFFWYLSYVGLGPLLFAVMFQVCQAFDQDHSQDPSLESGQPLTLLANFLSFTRYYSIATMGLTQLVYPTLIIFLQKFNIDEPEFRIQFGSSDSKPLTKIEVEKRDIYLVMMSSTYFLPLKQSFFVKSKENLKRVKRAIVSTRNRGRKANIAAGDAVKKRTKTKSEEPVSIDNLKKSKDELNKKLKGHNKKTISENSKKTHYKSEKKEIHREKSYNLLQPLESEVSKGVEVNKGPTSLKYKGECFSEADKDYLANWEALNEIETGQKQSKDDNLCYVCYNRPPNAVVMKCGHGGICYECALEFAKEKNQCMECRGAIENVIKINPTPKMRNIIKGYETTKLIALNQEDDE